MLIEGREVRSAAGRKREGARLENPESAGGCFACLPSGNQPLVAAFGLDVGGGGGGRRSAKSSFVERCGCVVQSCLVVLVKTAQSYGFPDDFPLLCSFRIHLFLFSLCCAAL